MVCPRRYFALIRWIFFSTLICSIVFLVQFSTRTYVIPKRRHSPTVLPLYHCPSERSRPRDLHRTPSSNRTKEVERRILLVPGYNHKFHSDLSNFLDYLKTPVRVELASFKTQVKAAFLQYGRSYSVGIVAFLEASDNPPNSIDDFDAHVEPEIESLRFMAASEVPQIAKPDVRIPVEISGRTNWTVFKPAAQWRSFLEAEGTDGSVSSVGIVAEETDKSPRMAVLGHNLSFWAMKIALLDAVSYASYGNIDIGADRYVQVDIDDIFVGQSGTRLTPPDVPALIGTQDELRSYIQNFTFSLGFSGYFFRRGDEFENRGDEQLVASATHFNWFPHMWRHNHAHEYTKDYLVALMTQNKFFANNTNIATNLRYAVAPQHTGVFPVYEPLFDAWAAVWNVSVTSTEEYPHLRPPSRRRGFVHRNVSVLPRQTCGLFTHTHLFHAYPDGFETLKNSILGGDLFTSVLVNPFSIFMTHQQNFGSDRLGSYTFLSLARFVTCWTSLRLQWIPPVEMAERYFTRFSDEKTMLYTNPCSDARHKKMLPANATCDDKILPNVVILGPQKTGTSALANFLSLHPNVSTNAPVEGSFEELQFFNEINYGKGLDWYMQKFSHSAPEHSIVFEKSANYFDSDLAPRAVKALIPHAFLVVLLLDPVDRAYSWYQHARAHGDPVAERTSAFELFTGNSTDTRRLRNRCLWPGLYARHLDRWLDHYEPSQFILIDAKQLREKPAVVMRYVVDRLGLSRDAVDFDARLQFVDRKGFYCAVNGGKSGKPKCLGRSKGRKYEQMPPDLRAYLEQFYAEHNQALARLLQRYNFPLPEFLHSYHNLRVLR
ncbi:bifunctional heparan sulfate N-deacetylase/N-sulfotransferase 4-like isoform X1 [Aphelenchoides avenae]|nr:bifunctional heparan sulfate N-deacetylase/N-sulfotransferase 4-like isoform X1 [Aphelenchus avenae]